MNDDSEFPMDEGGQPTRNRPSPPPAVHQRQSYTVEMGNDEAVEISLSHEIEEVVPDDDNIIIMDEMSSSSQQQQQSTMVDETASSAMPVSKILSDLEESAPKQRMDEPSAFTDTNVIPDATKSTAQQVIEEPATSDTVAQMKDEENDTMMEERNKSKCPRGKKLWILVALVILVIIAAIVGGVLGSQIDCPTQAPTISLVPSVAPSQVPSQSPTTVRSKVEAILTPYVAPLDEETLFWLTGISTWQPPADARDYDYQWLERYVMAFLYKSLDGPYWSNSNNWVSDLPTCEWYSVERNDCSGPVRNIVLPLNNLRGNLPKEIYQLTALTKISLPRNAIDGTLHESIMFLQELTHLDLASNRLNATIPNTLPRMTNLEFLYLSGNLLYGTFMDMIVNAPMTNLKVLSVFDNILVSTIPESVRKMTNLQDLSLHENNLYGSIPSTIGDLTALTRLSLNTNNRLEGTIPETIAKLTMLNWLSVFETSLQGQVPRLPNNRDVELKCFFGECYSDLSQAELAGCIILNNC